MLILSRKVGEKIVINDSIIVEVLQIQGQRVRFGIVAPPDAEILRAELTLPDYTVILADEEHLVTQDLFEHS